MSRTCPNCQYPLETVVYKTVLADHCRRCGGTFLDPGEETELLGLFTSPELWKDARITTELGPSWHNCPDHRIPFTAYSVRFGEQAVEVDLCPECRGMWLDASEGMRLRNIVMSAGQSGETGMSERPGIPSYLFQVVSGFPREVWNPMRRPPRVTLGIIVTLYLVFAIQMLLIFIGDVENYQWLISTFAMKPANVLAGSHLWTPLTSAFLHCGVAHIIGNTYFLYIFGDNVEDFLGESLFWACISSPPFPVPSPRPCGKPMEPFPAWGRLARWPDSWVPTWCCFPR